MTMVSYAQNGEDVLLARLFPQADGFYIDVGANDPVADSVTKHFHDRGWRGINVEPEPAAFARMVAGRPDDLNLNLGISEAAGVLTFFDAPKANGWSTFSTAQARNLRERGVGVVERPIPVLTLAEVCARYVGDRTIDFLKVDAESHEVEVLAGADWSRWRPRAILIETNGWEAWEPPLLAADYLFAAFDGINRYYLRAEDRDLIPRLAVPLSFVDDYVPYLHHRQLDALRRQVEETSAALASERARADRAVQWIAGLPRVVHGLYRWSERRQRRKLSPKRAG